MSRGVRLRPHHCACLQLFEGKGYSQSFVEAVEAISKRLAEEPETMVTITDGPDDICAACPNLRGECASAEKVAELDRRWAAFAGLLPGAGLRWRDAAGAVSKGLAEDGVFADICGRCQWFALCGEIRKRKK